MFWSFKFKSFPFLIDLNCHHIIKSNYQTGTHSLGEKIDLSYYLKAKHQLSLISESMDWKAVNCVAYAEKARKLPKRLSFDEKAKYFFI